MYELQDHRNMIPNSIKIKTIPVFDATLSPADGPQVSEGMLAAQTMEQCLKNCLRIVNAEGKILL